MAMFRQVMACRWGLASMLLRRVPWLERVEEWVDMVDSALERRVPWVRRVDSVLERRVSKRFMLGSSIVYSFASEHKVNRPVEREGMRNAHQPQNASWTHL